MPQNKKAQTLKRVISIGLIAALLLFFVYSFTPKPVPVDMAQVTRGAMQVTVSDEGYTRIRDVYVVSAPITGHLLRLERKVGDSVKAGETLLARLLPSDPGFLDTRSKSQAEAAVRSAQARLEFARSDARRARELAKLDSISRTELDRAELALKTARAELENAQAVLITPDKTGQGNSAVVKLVAPVDGRILRLLQESETVVAAGTPLVELGNPQELEIVVDLLSRDAVRVKEGAAVSITGWGSDNALSGSVRRVEPTGFTKVSALGIEEQRVNVIIDINNPRSEWPGLGHGFRVDAAVSIWQAEEVLQLPTAALLRHQGKWAVFKVDNGNARLTPVELGHNNGQQAEVLDGVTEGEIVILHPSERIEDGIQVEARRI